MINNETDKNWFKAEQKGQSGFIPANYVQLLPHPWMHGKITRVKAEEVLLATTNDGVSKYFFIKYLFFASFHFRNIRRNTGTLRVAYIHTRARARRHMHVHARTHVPKRSAPTP